MSGFPSVVDKDFFDQLIRFLINRSVLDRQFRYLLGFDSNLIMETNIIIKTIIDFEVLGFLKHYDKDMKMFSSIHKIDTIVSKHNPENAYCYRFITKMKKSTLIEKPLFFVKTNFLVTFKPNFTKVYNGKLIYA